VACALGKKSGMLVAKEILPNEVNFVLFSQLQNP